jgi:hypothetical protein
LQRVVWFVCAPATNGLTRSDDDYNTLR